MEGLVKRRSEAYVTVVRNHAYTIARLDRTSAAVVHHDHFEIRERLPIQGVQTFGQRIIGFESRNHHGHRRVRLAGPRFSYHFKLCVAEPMQAISGRPSPFRSATAHAAAAIPPSSSV